MIKMNKLYKTLVGLQNLDSMTFTAKEEIHL